MEAGISGQRAQMVGQVGIMMIWSWGEWPASNLLLGFCVYITYTNEQGLQNRGLGLEFLLHHFWLSDLWKTLVSVRISFYLFC